MPSFIERLAHTISSFVANVLEPPADFLANYVWGWPPGVPLIVAVLLGTGLLFTFRLMFIQFRGFKHAIDVTRGVYDDPAEEGDLKHFQALTTALSATVGIGNIAGVAIALRMGGPGALFWMWVSAFLGMSLKYAECTLAVKYRKINPDGSVSGGPMYYIEKGLGPSFKWMAIFFAAMLVICSFGSGNMNQSNTMAVQMESTFGIARVWTSLIFAALVGTVIIGGIQRIGKVTAILAPGMALLYVLGALAVLVVHAANVPASFMLIVEQAFSPDSLVGGGVGSIWLTMMWGIRRGLFSNEAGQGSAPIAHATAKTHEPVREGLVGLLEPFIDTLVICTMTGLVVISSGAFSDRVERTLPASSLEAVVAAGATDAQLLALREARAAAPASTVEVRDGVAPGLSFVQFDALLHEVRLETADGAPWSGTLEVAASGAVSAAGGAPVVRGKTLLTGAELTARAFRKSIGGVGELVVALAVLLFAVSTGISWSYYGDRGTEYLFGSRFIPVYRWAFVGFFFLGGILPLQAVWTMGDVALGLMSFPNLIALVALSGTVVAMTRDYFSREHKPFKK